AAGGELAGLLEAMKEREARRAALEAERAGLKPQRRGPRTCPASGVSCQSWRRNGRASWPKSRNTRARLSCDCYRGGPISSRSPMAAGG
ncbi:MAG TPA: hypothetical protein VK911_03100, partial [Vicinamibacterales bacterium]|nr:hypothetical protein [Vicinamibacterales bacterium]